MSPLGRAILAASLCFCLTSCGYLQDRRSQKADRALADAEMALQENEFKRVIEKCDQVLNLRGPDVQAIALRGYARFCQGESQSAFADLNRAIQMDPGYAQAYRYRAVMWGAAGRKDRAADDRFAAVALKDRRSVRKNQDDNNYTLPGQDSVQPDGERAEELKALAEDPLAQDLMRKASRLGGEDNEEVLNEMKDSIRDEGREDEFRDLKDEAMQYLNRDPSLDDLLE